MKRTKITIGLMGGEVKQIAASVEDTGAFAVHRTIGSEGDTHKWYSVTHVKSGRCIASYLRRPEAVEIATLAAACDQAIFSGPRIKPDDTDAYRAFRKAVPRVG